MSTLIKICGLTRKDDVEAAAAAGADLLGFVFAASPRQVSAVQVREITSGLAPGGPLKVGVFVETPARQILDLAESCKLDIIQLHRPAMAEDFDLLAAFRLLPVYRLGGAGKPPAALPEHVWATLFDTWLPDQAGGGGRVFDWSLVEKFCGRRFFLAGGLGPENVGLAVSRLKPFGVDVSSGVEAAPGVKDQDRIRAFITAVKEAEKLSL